MTAARRKSKWILLLLGSVLIAALLQAPLAWAWAYLYPASGYAENSRVIERPVGVQSPIVELRVCENHFPGVHWVTITAWSQSPGPSMLTFRSDVGEPFDSNPTWPWSPEYVYAPLGEQGQWPSSYGAFAPTGVATGVEVASVEGQGWPFLCVQGKCSITPTSSGPLMEGLTWVGGWNWRTWPRKGMPMLLPYNPIWSGYVLNSVIHGTALFVPVVGLVWMRRRLRDGSRRRRGLCIRCAYDLRATPSGSPCPECGSPPGHR